MSRVPSPGAARLTIVLSAVFLAVLAYPWQSATERWVLGVAVVVVLVSLAWWRGRHVTTILGQWIRMTMHRKAIQHSPLDLRYTATEATTTVLLRVEGSDRQVPLRLLTGYLDRYGLVCESIRLTTHSTMGGTTTWIGLTFSAARNLAALQARSAQLPLRQTAEAAARRMLGQLGEMGYTATLVDRLPDAVATDARERWQSVTDSRGHVTTYSVDPATEETLTAVRASAAGETWTVIEVAGTATQPRIRAAAAIRTDAPPAATAPGLVPVPGRQANALAALHPLSGTRLIG
jgi:type VII secretion protein EccE